ncbi:hypothetical protein [Streptomyces sp. NPDC048111]|uniref:hypothetical protein n=1 Tax=Streptomyces sp. NPDC048111 TaxID=3365500 RepID=UPI00371E8506
MKTTTTAGLTHPGARKSLDTVGTCVTLFGAVSAIVLGTVAVMAATGHQVTAFMWIRAAILLAAAPLLHRMAGRAAQGSYKDFDRLRTLSSIAPVAIIAVDLIPGLCPPWYTVLQGLSAAALIAVAVLARGAALRTAFPKE